MRYLRAGYGLADPCHHRGMDWYIVTKTINGRRYLYRQKTWREGRRVRTQNEYIGPVGSAALVVPRADTKHIDVPNKLDEAIGKVLGRFEGDSYAWDLLNDLRNNMNGIDIDQFIDRLESVIAAIETNRFAREGVEEILGQAYAARSWRLKATALETIGPSPSRRIPD
jgi:hypothetical protein